MRDAPWGGASANAKLPYQLDSDFERRSHPPRPPRPPPPNAKLPYCVTHCKITVAAAFVSRQLLHVQRRGMSRCEEKADTRATSFGHRFGGSLPDNVINDCYKCPRKAGFPYRLGYHHISSYSIIYIHIYIYIIQHHTNAPTLQPANLI